jgi:tetratricopeptide (TPR) repeat protein
MAGLTQEAMTRLERAKAYIQQYSIDNEPNRWAHAHMTLSYQCVFKVRNSSGPTRAADKGIEHIEEVLKVITEENHAESFAVAQCNLAHMYPKRVAGNHADNLTKALACAETALRVCQEPSCELFVVAEVYAIIGSIYADDNFESSNSRAANQDLAIRNYLASLERSSMYDDNDLWANTQRKVGLIYYNRKNGKRRSNVKVAIKHWLEALKVFTKSKHLNKWATAHQSLALGYSELFETADRAASLAKMSEEEFAEQKSAWQEKWIASCTNALQVFTPTYGSTSW